MTALAAFLSVIKKLSPLKKNSYNYYELESVITIPDSWILLFKIKGQPNWKYVDCEEYLSSSFAREIIPDKNAFQKVEKHKTKISWGSDQYDVCIDCLLEDGIELQEIRSNYEEKDG